MSGEIIWVQPQPCHILLYDVCHSLVVKLGIPGQAVSLEAPEQGAFVDACCLHPISYSPDGADFLVWIVGNGNLAAGTGLVSLGLGNKDDEALGGKGEILHLDSYQLRTAEGSRKAQEQQSLVPEGYQVIAGEHICQQGQGFHKDRGLAMLEGSLFPADGLHGIVNHDVLGRIGVLVAGGNMVLGDGGYPARNRIGLGMVCQIIDVVDNILWLAGQGRELMGLTPVGKVIPVGRIGLQGIVAFGLAHTAFALGREKDILVDVLVVI